jgi:hypothetical protein
MITERKIKKYQNVGIWIVALAAISGLLHSGWIAYTNSQKPPSVAGVNETVTNTSINSAGGGAPENTLVKTTLPKQQAPTPQQIEIKLDGNGCTTNNTFPNKCTLLNSSRSGLVLKECVEEVLDKCSMYTYTLGKRDTDTQYILQQYTEQGDTLLDVKAYNITSGNIQLIGTYLYSSNLPQEQDQQQAAKNRNSEYTQALSTYR